MSTKYNHLAARVRLLEARWDALASDMSSVRSDSELMADLAIHRVDDVQQLALSTAASSRQPYCGNCVAEECHRESLLQALIDGPFGPSCTVVPAVRLPPGLRVEPQCSTRRAIDADDFACPLSDPPAVRVQTQHFDLATPRADRAMRPRVQGNAADVVEESTQTGVTVEQGFDMVPLYGWDQIFDDIKARALGILLADAVQFTCSARCRRELLQYRHLLCRYCLRNICYVQANLLGHIQRLCL